MSHAIIFLSGGGCTDFTSNVPITIGGDVWTEAPDEMAMKRGILKRIVYPTGGFVDFDFESNRYLSDFSNGYWYQRLPQLSGGLRIRSINYYDEGDLYPKSQKYFRYGEMEEGTGILVNSPDRETETGVYNISAVSYEQEVAYLRRLNPGPCDERRCMELFTKETKTTYQPAAILDYNYSSGAPIYYTKVTEYQQDLGERTGKTVHQYYDPEEFHKYPAPLILENRIPGTNLNFLKTDGLMGALESVTRYKMGQDQRYSPLHRKRYNYQTYLYPKQVHVAYSFPRVIYEVVQGEYNNFQNFYDMSQDFGSSSVDSDEEFIYGEYGIPSGKLLLKEEEETWFEESGTRQVTTFYDYDKLLGSQPYVQATRTRTTDSRGKAVTKTLKYAYDFGTVPVYAQMVADNMISQVIEQVETTSAPNQEISRVRTNYKLWPVGWGLIAPDTIQRSVKGEALQVETIIQAYDQHGNVLQRTGRDGIPTSYLWGYNGLYPVAELRNVTYASIPNTYKSNGQINHPGSDASLRTLLGGLYTTYSGQEKQVNLYTYKRLVGLTSQTAPNRRTGYHEYDGIGRLVMQRDHEQQVVNQYEYQMAGPRAATVNQPHDVNIPMMWSYLNSYAQEGNFLYNYTVPGGRYISSSVQSANFSARNEAGQLHYPQGQGSRGTRLEHSANIQLVLDYFELVNHASMVEVDFLQEGSIVATQQVNSYNIYKPYTTLDLPEGDYQVSVRINADLRYVGGILGYTLFNVEDESIVRFKSGDTVTLLKDGNYILMVSDHPS